MQPTTSNITRWLVVLTASLLFFYNFYILNMLSSISNELMMHFELNATQFGSFSSKYFWANFLFLIPAGLLLDRYSTRKIILLSMLLCIVSVFGFALAPNAFLAGAARFMGGLAGAFVFLSCIRLASRWFPSDKMAMVTGWIITVAFIGGMVAQAPMEILARHWGWKNATLGFGALGIVIFILMLLILQDWPVEHESSNAAEEHKAAIAKLGVWQNIKMVALNRYNWLAGLYTTLMNLPIFILCALWGIPYLLTVHHLPKVQGAIAVSMIYIGAIVGSPLLGWVSDRIKRRVMPMFIGSAASLLIILMIIYLAPLSFFAVFVLFFLLGMFTTTQNLGYPVAAELNSPLVTSSAISIISLLIMSSGFVCQPLFGWLMDLHWNMQVVNGEPIYAASDFNTAMLMMPVGFIISFAIAFFIKETNCKPQVK